MRRLWIIAKQLCLVHTSAPPRRSTHPGIVGARVVTELEHVGVHVLHVLPRAVATHVAAHEHVEVERQELVEDTCVPTVGVVSSSKVTVGTGRSGSPARSSSTAVAAWATNVAPGASCPAPPM